MQALQRNVIGILLYILSKDFLDISPIGLAIVGEFLHYGIVVVESDFDVEFFHLRLLFSFELLVRSFFRLNIKYNYSHLSREGIYPINITHILFNWSKYLIPTKVSLWNVYTYLNKDIYICVSINPAISFFL